MSLDFSAFRLSPRGKRLALVVWLLAVIAGYFALMALLVTESLRDTRQWEVRLSLVTSAESRAVSGWIHARQGALQNLADNVSLKLYLTELGVAKDEQREVVEEPAQITYLRNLIISSAQVGGFATAASETESFPSGVALPPAAGIGLLDAKAAPVVATRRMPPMTALPEALRDFNDKKQARFVGPFALGEDGALAVAFRLPVYGVQADVAMSDPLGYVVGVAALDSVFYALLKEPTMRENTAESLLLVRDKESLLYASPLLDGKAPMELKLDATSADAGAQAVRAPGTLISGVDYRGKDVFAYAAPVEGTEWMALSKIDRKVALADTRARAFWLRLSYFLAVGVITAGLIALWRQATVLRVTQAANHYRDLVRQVEKQEQLLELIAENTPIATWIVDAKQTLLYANRRAAADAGMERDAMIGKPLDAAMGGARSRRLAKASEEALDAKAETQSRWREDSEGSVPKRVLHSRHIPLHSVPLAGQEDKVPGVLVIEEDITDIVREEERNQKTLRRLIDTLVAIIDRRDPGATHHSQCVAETAKEVARHMGLEGKLLVTAETAGRLMNLGKIMVPQDTLTSKDPLPSKEKDSIRAAIMASADLLEGIAFDGPVVETIRQSLEHVDGSGPLGLKGEQILMTARIVGAVNDFVAMISPRAYRPATGFNDAMRTMFEGMDKEFDRGVVTALMHYLNNDHGRETLAGHLGLKAA